MATFNPADTGYVDVAERIANFREKYPEGSLQPADAAMPYRIEKIGSDVFVVVVAAAYRTANDARPGIGMAYEVYPGRTPYTRGSELQNAETSAWGRAIVAALAADTKRGIASHEEVRNRQAEQESKPVVTDDKWIKRAVERIGEATTLADLRGLWEEMVVVKTKGRLADQDRDDLEAQILARRADFEAEKGTAA